MLLFFFGLCIIVHKFVFRNLVFIDINFTIQSSDNLTVWTYLGMYVILFVRIDVTKINFCHMGNRTHDLSTNWEYMYLRRDSLYF